MASLLLGAAVMRKVSLLSLLPALALACGGDTITASTSFDPTTGGLQGTPPVALAPFSAAEVAGALATCAGPHGSVDEPTSAQDLATKLVGAWISCKAKSKYDALELRADGTFAYLERQAHGDLEAATGAVDAGRWKLNGIDNQRQPADGAGAIYYLDLYCGACGASESPVLEKNPRRMVRHRWDGGPYWVPLTH
ncbi:MAG: hypothetical protein IPG50_35085 [Myxococcales bacterium]|nr:hypothetical protein [Myxococcales bacterium]